MTIDQKKNFRFRGFFKKIIFFSFLLGGLLGGSLEIKATQPDKVKIDTNCDTYCTDQGINPQKTAKWTACTNQCKTKKNNLKQTAQETQKSINSFQLLGRLSNSGCISKGDCTLNDFVELFVIVSKLILSIVGSLALLMFVIGGMIMLASAGSPERVKKGQGVIVAAVIGIVIVFLSYLMIDFLFEALGLGGTNWKSSDWF